MADDVSLERAYVRAAEAAEVLRGEGVVIDVAFTVYPQGKDEETHWHKMPVVPRVGDTVHLPIIEEGESTSMALQVRHVSWSDDHPQHPGWHAEVALG